MNTVYDFGHILLVVQICRFEDEGLGGALLSDGLGMPNSTRSAHLWHAYIADEIEKMYDIVRLSEPMFLVLSAIQVSTPFSYPCTSLFLILTSQIVLTTSFPSYLRANFASATPSVMLSSISTTP